MALNQNFSDFFDKSAAAPKPAAPKKPAEQPAPAADPFAGVPAWTDIQAKPEFQALSAAKQAEAKQAYFDYWIAPRVGQDSGAIREQFLGAPVAPAPEVDEQAGQAAFGVYPKAKSAKPKPTAGQLLEQPAPPAAPGTEPEFVSRVPVRPEVRRAFEATWNAATPIERLQMESAPGWTGQLARERAGYAKMRDEARAKASESMRTMLEAMDPRAEFRAARLRMQGEDPRFAETAAREGAKRGVTPGQEIKALDGTVQTSDFDFDTARFFDPKNPANGANNALVRGITKGALGIGKAYAGLFQFQSDLVGFDAASKSAAGAGRSMRGQEEAIGERGTFLERNLEGAVSSIAQQLPLLITGTAVASQAIPLAGMALQSFGQEYSDGRAKGQNPGQATTRAAMFAAFEVIGEKFGLGAQMDALRAAAKGMPTGEIANLLFSALKKEIPGELLTTTGQFSVDKFAGNGIGLNPNATFGDYMKQVADTIAQTIMQSGLMGAGTTGVSTGVRFLRDRDVSQGVAEADAEAAKRTALDRWSGFMGRKQPAATTPTTVDGRIEPTMPATQAGDPLVQTADDIVRGMAADAGLPESTVLPTAPRPAAPPAIAQADQDIIDFAGTRFQQLRDKQGTPEEPGPGLSASESQELQVLVQARGNPVALREFYGIDQPGEADVRQTQEPLDGPASGPATGQDAQGQAAPGAVPEQPGQQPNEDGQAQGLDQAIDGLGALFGGQQQETEAQREARLEREAIQGEQDTQVAPPTNDDDIPLDLGPPRTEKEARQRKEQQTNVQAGQAQQTQAPTEEAVPAPAAPQAGGAEGGVGPRTEKEAALLKQYENSVNQWNELSAQYKTSNEDQRAELRPMMDALNIEQALIKGELQRIALWRNADVIRKEAEAKYGVMPVGTRIGMIGYEGRDDSYWEKVGDDQWQRTMGGKTDEVFKTSAEMEGSRVVQAPAAPKTENKATGKAPVIPAGFVYSLTSSPAYDGVETLSVDDADFELEALQNRAEKGRLTTEQFAQSEIAKRLDTGQVMEINEGLRADPVATIKALRDRLKQAPASKPKTEREAKRQRDVEDLIAQVNSATSLEELSKIAREANARFPEADVMGEGEPNDDDRAMGAVSRAAAQRAKQITEGGQGGATGPKTEKEARERRLAEKPLPEWTQKTQNFPANTTFAWQQEGNNVVLVAKVGDKEFGSLTEGEAKTSISFGSLRLMKSLTTEALRQAGGDTNSNWTPAGGDTSVEDAKKRKEQSKDNRSRAKRQLEAAIEKADEAGAMKTKSKLVDLLMAFDRKDKGPGQVTKALESLDADIEKETTSRKPVSEEEKFVIAVSEITFDKGTVQDFINKHGKAAFKRALELGYIDNTLEFPTSKLFATNKVVYELQQKYYDFNGGRGRPVRKKPEKAKPAPTPAAPTPAAPTPATPDLKGVKVKFDVMVEDTGQTASMTVDAAAQMKEYEDRESVLRELIACLQK